MKGTTTMLSHISFVSIPVTDQARARAFYADKLGMEVTVDAPYEDMRWIMLKIPGADTQLHLDKVDELPPQRKPTLPLIAPDVAAAIGSLRERGVEIVAEPKPAEWDADTTYALIRDSEGNLLLLTSK
jgi:predicted enzyme related to lactoylglutathione lyase